MKAKAIILAQGLALVTMRNGAEFTQYEPNQNDTNLTFKGVNLRVSFSFGVPSEDIGPRFFVEQRTDHGTLLSGGDVDMELERLLNSELVNISME